MRTTIRGTAALAATLAITLAVIVVAGLALRGVRLDLTEHSVYTLSAATRDLLRGIDEEIDVTVYFSEAATEGMPELRTYAERVREVVREMAGVSGGRIRVHDADPAPFSEEEDAATAAGLVARPTGFAGDSIYFGIVGRNAEGRTETLAYLAPEREQFLEYELARLLYLLDREKSPAVGLVTELPVSASFDFNTGRQTGGFMSVAQLEQLFDVRRPVLGEDGALDDIDVLLLVHPKGLSPRALYQVDQFVLGGGRLLAFVDPHAEADTQVFSPMMPPMPAENSASDLGGLLAAWGVGFDNTQVVADATYALTVSVGPNAAPVRHLGMLGIDEQGIAAADVVTAPLRLVNVSSAGALVTQQGATTRLEPLLQSSAQASLMAAERFKMLADPGSLQADFKASGERYVLAARVSGPAKTAFPDGEPPAEAAAPAAAGEQPSDAVPPPAAGSALGAGESAAPGADGPAAAAGQADADAAAPVPHVHRADGDISVILVADSDLLGDLLWVRVQEFLGQRIATPWASNGDLLVNAVDHLTGSTALVNVRSRAGFQRPFTRVQALLRTADERMVRQQLALQQELEATEKRLLDLEGARDKSDGPGLTAEQEAELAQFTQQKLEIRRKLRQVQRELTLDIESLGRTLKLINVLAVPALLVAVGLLFALRRRA
jgi:ABC-type uncharacterized transport system involved in gliding motility auxiliary subunit